MAVVPTIRDLPETTLIPSLKESGSRVGGKGRSCPVGGPGPELEEQERRLGPQAGEDGGVEVFERGFGARLRQGGDHEARADDGLGHAPAAAGARS